MTAKSEILPPSKEKILPVAGISNGMMECPHCKKASHSHYKSGDAFNENGEIVKRYMCIKESCRKFFIFF